MFTLSSSAISASVFKSGCMVLVHHFETVVGSLPSCWANHFPCLSVSASTALILLILTTSIFNKLVYDANLLIVSEASKTMAFYRLKFFFEVFSGYADRLHSGYLTLQCQPSAHRPKGDKQKDVWVSGRNRLAAFGERNQPSAKGPSLPKGSECRIANRRIPLKIDSIWANLSASANTGVSHSGYCRRLELLEPHGEKISRLRTS